ncbi:MAG: UDP-N-acetylglucosamine--N-acetylmuramyl-(pentapeptide) pyrophosphoryl-undecaprenol N-acetylglucosamine transferase [Chloroflexi bacterium]|nr:UDP-N-acetylglucosamine--N-acetylmuramyl-(pentapeptide) pyrophosphoryl-undecaprenol N-acetylglucosamine transferase [Chloroflexota bacterium]
MRLLISGGGTGGHVYPALTVVAALQRRAPERVDNATLSEANAERLFDENETLRSAQGDKHRVILSEAKNRVLQNQTLRSAQSDQVLYLGRANSVEERLVQQAQIPFASIQSGQVRGMAPWVVARSLWRMFRSVDQIRKLIRDFKPDVTFVTGGYVSAPVIWASAAEKIPSVIYLPDLEPGWAIRATARWATRVAVSFPEAEKYFAPGQAVTTGYPVRAEFYQSNKIQSRKKIHLDPNARTVAIFGGSTGARHINQAAVANLVELTKIAQVVHLTGRPDEAWVNEQVAKLTGDLRARVRVFGYLEEDLPHALASADVVIARAGAATLGEFPALGLPAILVPGPYAGLHQERNADFLVECGAALKVADAVLSRELIPMVTKLFDAPEQLQKMSDAMRTLAVPHAAENIVDLLESLVKK